MARQNWQAGNMLYPLPAVMVSCQRPKEKPNIITVAWTGNHMQYACNGIDFRPSGAIFV